jgi:rod shape-determining protein MreD
MLGLSPFGLSTIVALAVCGSAQVWRRELADSSFILVWMAFAGTAMLAFFLSWTLAALVLEQWPNPWPLVLQTVVNIALYPLLTLLFGRLQHALFE